MEWIKIDKDTRPEFDEPVFLIQMMDQASDPKKAHKIGTGVLRSIDANGYNWSISNQSISDTQATFASLFGDALSKEFNKNKFTPTHYCLVELPKN